MNCPQGHRSRLSTIAARQPSLKSGGCCHELCTLATDLQHKANPVRSVGAPVPTGKWGVLMRAEWRHKMHHAVGGM